MPSPQHNGTKHKFTQSMPGADETVVLPGHAHAESHTAVRRDAFEDDVEDREDDGVAVELACFDQNDEEYGDSQEPEIVAELGADLGAEEVSVGPVRSWGGAMERTGAADTWFGRGVAAVGPGEGAFETREDLRGVGGWGG